MEPPPGPAWTRAEDKAFEAALLTFPDQTPGRWRRIARAVPGKSPEEMEKHFDALVDDVIAISSGLVPLPVYNDEPKQVKTEVMKKKGKAWSEEEHLLFLEGLKRYGKGDWRGISRNIVKTKTATQVASHAQKYFNRQNVKNKGRRTSIHDLTLDVLNPVDNSSLMQNSFQDNSIGYDNITNMNCNQEGMLVTNNNSISPPSQYRGSLQGHNNSNSGEIHLQNHLSFGKTSIPEHLSSSSARFFNHGGVLVNGHPSDMYYQGGVPKYENFTMPRNKLSVSTPNQFTIDNNGNILDMNGHLISPQSLYSPKGIPMGYYDINMIGQSTPPPPHLQCMNGHMGPHLPSSQTIHTPHRSLYMGHDDTKVGSHGGASDNQMKGNEAKGFNSLPDQSPNAPKKAHLQRMNGHMGSHLPSSQTIHTPHRSLYMGHDDTKVGSHGGASDNQMKGNEAEGFNSLPDQSPNAPKKAHLQRMNGHMGPHLPSSQTIHTPHRSLYMGHDDTKVGSHGGASDNQMKGNEAEGFNSLPDQSPNAPKKAHLQRMNGHMGPHLPSSQTIHTPHRSLYMSHDDTKVGSHGGASDNQMKGNEAEGFNSLPDQSPNAPKKAKFRSCSDF